MGSATETAKAWRTNTALLIASLCLWALGSLTAVFWAVLLSSVALCLLVLVWAVLGIFSMVRCWRLRASFSRGRLLSQLAAFPVTAAGLVVLAWPAQSAVQYVQSAKYAELINDQAFLKMARNASNDFSYGMHKVEIDNHGSSVRLAFDREGYVVRSGAFVYDPERNLEVLTKTKEIEMFDYNLSYCRAVRNALYYCSFS